MLISDKAAFGTYQTLNIRNLYFGTMIDCSKLVLSALVLSLFWQSNAVELGEDITESATDLRPRFSTIIPSGENETAIISPFCIAVLLIIIQQGTAGNSSNQIDSLLGLGAEASKTYFRSLLDYIQNTSSDDALHWGNKMFVRNDLEIDADYQENIMKNFKVELEKVNFELDDIGKSMNDWVSLITNGSIHDAVSPTFLTPETFILLASTISFTDQWDTPFNVRDTEDDVFHVNDTAEVTVPFMVYKNRNTTMGQNDAKGFKWIRLGYSKSPSTFIAFVLPTKRFGLNEFIKIFDAGDLKQMLNEEKTEMVNIAIPKFNITSHKLLKNQLKELGVVDIFDEEANLSGMIKSHAGVKISDISHNCKIEINEKGTTASAVASANFQFLSGSMDYSDNAVFKLDEPFLFFLFEKKVEMPYFVGQVFNPLG